MAFRMKMTLMKLDNGYMGIDYNSLYFCVCFKISIIKSFKKWHSKTLQALKGARLG